MNPNKAQVSPQPVLKYVTPEDHINPMDYFILDKTWYAINSFIKLFGINPWKKQKNDNGISTLQLLKPIHFWLHFAIVFIIINGLEFFLGVYLWTYVLDWDTMVRVNRYMHESELDMLTGFSGSTLALFLYAPLVYKLRKFGQGVVQSQEYFKFFINEKKKSCKKISICNGR